MTKVAPFWIYRVMKIQSTRHINKLSSRTFKTIYKYWGHTSTLIKQMTEWSQKVRRLGSRREKFSIKNILIQVFKIFKIQNIFGKAKTLIFVETKVLKSLIPIICSNEQAGSQIKTRRTSSTALSSSSATAAGRERTK